MTKTALVMSGGGSHGAFAVGAVDALMQTLRATDPAFAFDLVAGTSTGSIIAPFVVTDEIAVLKQFYTSVHNQDILDDNVPLQTILDAGYVYTMAPFQRKLTELIVNAPARWATLTASSCQIFLATTCFETASEIYYQLGGTPGVGVNGGRAPVPITLPQDLVNAIAASSCEPVLTKPQRISLEPGGAKVTLVDGGVLDYAPLDIAIANGATDIYLIMHSPPWSARTAQTYDAFKGLPGMLLRTIDLLTSGVADGNLDLAELYAEGTRRLATVRKRAEALGLPAATADSLFAADPDDTANRFSNGLAVTIHVIRPEKEFEVAGLTFDPALMTAWYDEGSAAAEQVLASGAEIRMPGRVG